MVITRSNAKNLYLITERSATLASAETRSGIRDFSAGRLSFGDTGEELPKSRPSGSPIDTTDIKQYQVTPTVIRDESPIKAPGNLLGFANSFDANAEFVFLSLRYVSS